MYMKFLTNAWHLQQRYTKFTCFYQRLYLNKKGQKKKDLLPIFLDKMPSNLEWEEIQFMTIRTIFCIQLLSLVLWGCSQYKGKMKVNSKVEMKNKDQRLQPWNKIWKISGHTIVNNK